MAIIVVVIWLFWPARYPQLVLVGTTSGDSLALPDNEAGVNAAAELSGWAGSSRDRDRPKVETNPVVTVDATGAKIAIDPNPKNLVVYFTAHGGADATGPYLWMAPPEPRSATDAHKVRIRDIIDRVADARRGKTTLLIFDATRITISWPHGLLFNDFSRALKELDSEIDRVPGLAVACASDDDQRSWIFEERKMSVFGFYLLEALRGAGHGRGERVTAASAFAQVKAEVERWSVANRGEKQTPILLPLSNGTNRAEKIDLAAAPAAGHQTPTRLEQPISVPIDLEDTWKFTEQLAAQIPPPEANNPGLWREYLDLLVRYDRHFRIGANTTAIRDRATAIGGQLRNPSVGREPACLPAAIPTARALGRPPAFPDARAFESFRSSVRAQVWDAATPADRADSWAGLLRAHPGTESGVRIAAADLAVSRLIEDGPTRENLATADAVIGVTHGTAGLPSPTEAHFVRMLHLHLDKTSRPDPAIIKQALVLRREAEDAAWLFTAQPTDYPYSESVFTWVSGDIESADRNRQFGQDLLFGADPKLWVTAAKYFEDARTGYAKARTNGRKVAAGLATRDKVLARLPYYARWLAGYRGSRPLTEVDRLLDRAAAAARGAHRLAELSARELPPLDQLEKLDSLRAETDGHYKAITDAFDADVAALTNTPLPSNWHALDAALTVPFIPARRRVELLGHIRHVSHQLEVNRQQPDGSQVPPPPTREIAVRSGRMALAILGDTSPDRRDLIERPNPNAWWTSLRAGGDQIGDQFRLLPAEAKREAEKSSTTQTLKDAAPLLASAAFRARLADPAAPVAAPDPVAADHGFRRHAFLLWQAKRTTTEGWADVAHSSTADGWYCRKVASLLVASADTLMRETAAALANRPVENMSPAELDRWLGACKAEAARRPVELVLATDPVREIADEPEWTFAFKLSVSDAERGPVGFPVSWYDTPIAPYPQPTAGTTGRRIETDFSNGRPAATRPVRFTAIGPPRDVAGPGKLTTTVLYRGHLYQNPTEVFLVGTPTLDWRYTPPKGDTCIAIRADRSDVAGSVTILLDLTRSMTINLTANDKTTPQRLEEAKKGLELILKQLPRGTTVTLAYFQGDDGWTTQTVKPFGPPVVMDGTNWGRVYKSVKDATAEGGTTPLAGSIREVLEKDNARTFWPANFSTGSRTLIVLTDGEDNWPTKYNDPNSRDPGRLALEALRKTDDDVNLHIVFFGMTSTAARDEQKRAVKQFEILRQPEHFRDPPRTPAQLWIDVRDADGLADICRRAMLPQFPYSSGKRLADRLEATLPEEVALRTTTPLPPGVYDLWGLRGPQAIQLRPADRVLLQARRRDDKFELHMPAYAFETAQKDNLPRATVGTAATGGVSATVPHLKLINGSSHADLALVATMEALGERRAANLLAATRPKFAWFDIAYADGKPPEKGLVPCLLVENRWPVWAPAWNLNVARWEPAGADAKTARHPAVTGYWLDGYPEPAAQYPININDLSGSMDRLQKLKTVRVRESDVALLGITRENYSGPGLPAGEYLTVRMKYGKPGEMVFIRPGNLKGADQPSALHERHVYYDAQRRYTVRFGPLFPTDSNKDVTLDLHAVADLRDASIRSTRSVTVRIPEGALPSLTMPQDLEVQPRKDQ